jgi:uncharacterized damage-inducible protein DinB
MRDWVVATPDIVALFEFLYWQRDRALAMATELPPAAFVDPEPTVYRDLRSTLVHELDVERSWRLRLQGQPNAVWDVTLDAADYPDVATLADAWQREEADALVWLTDLTDEALGTPVAANGLEGYPLATYLVHVVMHGIESISAAAILLHRTGHSIGDVGFLDFADASGGPPTSP